MHTRLPIRRCVALAALAVIPAGLVAVTAPSASVETAQTARLHHGVLRITGTPDVDLIGVVAIPPLVTVDFGLDGTVEKRIPLRRVTSITIATGGDNDALHLGGTGQVPFTVDTGTGRDFVSARGRASEDGSTDAPTTIRTGGGLDVVQSFTPGPITIDTGRSPDSVVAGGPGVGSENVDLGPGNDFFLSTMDSSLGARHDVVDAGTGQNTMEIDGTSARERLALNGQDGHLLLTHDGTATVDSVGIGNLVYESHGGPVAGGPGDTVTVGDLTGTGLLRFTPDFSSNIEQTQPNDNTDRLVVTGTDGVDDISVSGIERTITIDGLATVVTPIWLTTPDSLVIDTLGGDDNVDTSQLQQGLVQVHVR